jgi:hypothetical protein
LAAGLTLALHAHRAAAAAPDAAAESYGYEGLEPAYGDAATNPVPRLFESLPVPADLDRPDGAAEASDPKLDDLETKIDQLRGQIQQTKSLILDLGEDVSQGFVSSTKLLVLHKNLLGSAFAIESIAYKLDGFTIYENHDAQKIAAGAEMVVFDAGVLPGNHTVDVVYTLRGTGYGVFTYMKEYKFDLRNQYYFSAPKGKAVELVVEAVDRGAGKTLRDRPTLRFAVR